MKNDNNYSLGKTTAVKPASLLLAVFFVLAVMLEEFDSSLFVGLGGRLIWTFDKSFYEGLGIYFYDNDYILSPSEQASCDFEFEQLCAFKKKLDEAGIDLLYVNKPTKYTDDSVFERFGVESFCNQNADLLISRLRGAGIEVLDLREEMAAEGLNVYDMFYRTDHHWTVPSGKWGAMHIARRLGESFGIDCDLSIYDDENFTIETYPEVWMGEQGAKFDSSALKKDDFTLVTPRFETRYVIDGTPCGFSRFMDESMELRHYLYSALTCENENVQSGRVMFFGDSFDAVTEPFLSLAVHSVEFHNLRIDTTAQTDVFDELIKGKDIDTVIVCYVPFMIGQHDLPSSDHRNMFSFMAEGESAGLPASSAVKPAK